MLETDGLLCFNDIWCCIYLGMDSGGSVLKSQEYGSDCMRSIEIELLDDDQSQPDGKLVLYIYSDSRVGTPRKY
jgi:hypothetical protein